MIAEMICFEANSVNTSLGLLLEVLSTATRRVHGLLQILPCDWLSYSLSFRRRPLAAKGINFQSVSVGFFEIIFCPTSWFILKQLDNLPSLSMSDLVANLHNPTRMDNKYPVIHANDVASKICMGCSLAVASNVINIR